MGSRNSKNGMSHHNDRPIGVFDSGLGGLTVVRAIRKVLPSQDIVYLGDTARVPYGTKSETVIKRFAEEDVEFLRKFDVKLIVVACHTVSSVAFQHLRQNHPELPIISVLEPSVEAAIRATKTHKIGIIGTVATIHSKRHEHELHKKGRFKVIAKPCPLFVPLVEEGLIDGEIPRLVAEHYLSGLIGKIDTLILACTHYPLLKPLIQDVVGEDVVLIDPSEEVALRVKSLLGESEPERKGKLEIYLTDIPPGYLALIERFLGEVPDAIIRTNLT